MRQYLQLFDYRSSHYARPNQKWVCGWAASGSPCRIGPDGMGRCRADFECRPTVKDGRWSCARSDLAGGRCDQGPLPDGTCCNAIQRCVPARSWRARRRLVSYLTAIAILGVVMIFSGGGKGPGFISPGDVTIQHAVVADCGGCHSAFDRPAASWIHAAIVESAATRDSERCLACHKLGAAGRETHGLPAERLAALNARAREAKSSDASVPIVLALASELDATAGAALPCTTCHREHQGKDFDLTAMSNQRCVICHEAKFVDFSRGHPEFSVFPHERRTRIQFDHVSHIGKHFVDEKFKASAPATCGDCHRAGPQQGFMNGPDFQVGCAACHADRIEGSARAGPKGIEIFTVPGLDVAALRERGAAIGEWPEDAEAEITPFMELLIGGDAEYVAARAALADLDLLDLTEADEAEIAAVETFAWSVKELLFDLNTEGMVAFKERLEGVMGRPLEVAELARLSGQLAPASVRRAQRQWLPDLLREVNRHRAGEAVPMPEQEAVPLAVDEDLSSTEADVDDESLLDEDEESLEEENELLDEDGDDNLDDDSLAENAESDEDDLLDEGAESADKDHQDEEADESEWVRAAEDWAAAGGWYIDEFALRYRPVGHADPFLRAWLDVAGQSAAMPGRAAAHRVFDQLSATAAPGACVKCHSIDQAAGSDPSVNWRAPRPTPEEHRFTVFSHVAHLPLLGDKGCLTCHALDREADYGAGFKDRNPATFASSFKPPTREACAACHAESAAGEDCVMCHNYHVGTIPAAHPKPPGGLTLAGQVLSGDSD
jgi:predicted CXXCH cytochrome family protein